LAVGVAYRNDPAPAEVDTRALHDALPISSACLDHGPDVEEGLAELADEALGEDAIGIPADEPAGHQHAAFRHHAVGIAARLRPRSEEHTSELQSRENLVCRLLLEKTKTRS